MSSNPFKPAWWLRNPHFQTIWPVVCKRKTELNLINERIDLPDGDFVDLAWFHSANQNAPFILILHGLEGSIESHYAIGMLNRIAQLGWHGLFMHFRGCSGEPNRFANDYHSGQTSDVEYVVQLIMQRYPQSKIGAVGYSLGGNVLLKWLGETGLQNPLKAAAAVSVPFVLNNAAMRIRQGFSKFYQWYFIRCLRARMLNKLEMLQPLLDPKVFYEVRTMKDYDNKITAPLNGFKDADEYYNLSSSRQFLGNITVPTLIVHAKDDPFMSMDVIPEPGELSDHIRLEVTEKGGHVGFVGGKFPWRPEYWLESRLPEFFAEYF